MKNFMLLLLFGYVIVMISGCNFLNHDDDTIEPNPIVLPPLAEDFVTENYPDHEVRSAETEDLCGDVQVLEVELEDGPGPDIDLYFTLAGEFLFSATDISVVDLPEAVRSTISIDFATYSIDEDDVERYDFPDGSVQYEVELIHSLNGNSEEAVFDEDGTLICFDGDDDDGGNDSTTVNLPNAVTDFIQAQYPGYVVTSAEQEDICDDVLMYEVELEDGPGPDIDLYFNLDWVFQFSLIEINVSGLPAAVNDAIAVNFPGFTIDEDKVEQLEWPNGDLMYAVELESSEEDVEVIFNADGSIYCEDE